MDNLSGRVVKVMELKQVNKTEFSSMLGISPAILSHISSGRNKPSVDVLQKILTTYPDISADWLLMGQGDVFRAKNINKETIIDALTAIDNRVQEEANNLIGIKELIKQQIEALRK